VSTFGPDTSDARRTPPSPLWLLLLAVALTELVALPVRTSRVASEQDWRDAGAFVRARHQSGDGIAVEPEWADPWLRWALGDLITLADAGRSDLAAYSRLWTLTLRGLDVPNVPASAPELDRVIGRVRVRRWRLPSPVVRYDFAQHIREATVSRVINAVEQPCPWQTMPKTRGGGLGVGALFPTERFVCDARRPWLFVAPLVLEDLALKPRHCLWQHPQGREPVVARFDHVTLQDELVFEGGLYYEHERDRVRGPVHVKLRFDQRDVGRMIHVDGDGWKRLVIDTRARHGQSVSVSVEVSADNPHFRTFCWNASTRVSGQPQAAQ